VREVLVTDTIAVAQGWEQLKVVSVAPLLASAIRRFAADGSIRDLY
jgi:ribose-phosphate pyrophosphokinase